MGSLSEENQNWNGECSKHVEDEIFAPVLKIE